jgi:hypothetical protein
MMYVVRFREIPILLVGLLGALVCACTVQSLPGNEPVEGKTPFDYPAGLPAGVTRVIFDEGANKTVSVEDLGKSAYLVKVNRSADRVLAKNAGLIAGSAAASLGVRAAASSGVFAGGAGAELFVHESSRNHEFNKNPPPPEGLAKGRAASAGPAQAGELVVGATAREFWVDVTNGSKTTWKPISTTARGAGERCSVWVADDCFDDLSLSAKDGKITQAQAEAIAAKFDQIYALETPVFGYEFGGGPGGNGGIDGDQKIQILVYDIDDDYTAGQSSGTLGFFWSKDEYAQSTLDAYYDKDRFKSNEAEMFYIDAFFSDYKESMMISTLIHEYQHMINFNVKTKRLGMTYATWYDEMLSMLAEDMIGPLMGIPVTDSAHPAADRTRLLLDGYYRMGPTEWSNDSTIDVLLSYATAYGFGAYLARNFGGVALVKAMSGNDFVDEASVGAALEATKAIHASGVTNFLQAVSRYGEAFVYDDPHGKPFSYNKTSLGEVGDTPYVFPAFDVFDMTGFDLSLSLSAWLSKSASGPTVLPTGESATCNVPPYGVLIFQDEGWKDLSSPLKIALTKPANDDVDFYILVR